MAELESLPPRVRGLALVSLGNDLASEMVYPLLPAFVTSTLGGGAVALGALDGAADLTASLLRWWSGSRADRPGWRGRLIAVGYAVATLARPLTSFATAAWQVIGVRVIDRVGKGLRSPARDAMIADLTPAKIRGQAFGLQRAADHLGAVLGSLLGFELLRRGASIREVLSASIVPGLAALAVLLWVLWRRGPEAEPEPRKSATEPGPAGIDRRLIWLAAMAAARVPETLLLLRLQDCGVAVAAVPLVWALLHVVRSVASYPAGVLADRLGRAGAIAVGGVAYAVTVLGLGLGVSTGLAVGLFLAHGLAAGVLEPAERAAVAAIRGARRGSLFGSYQGLAGLGALVLGIAYGWIYQSGWPGPALGFGAIATLAVLAVWLLVDRAVGRG